ncbi:MAG TPA: glycerol-3-phosphate 1-O-acyltransferase PlsY [Chloroflexota bacterium]|nr:glycerol-3-phosphate 1-O-acyltransferase PlsY [Chloroflexota bacterium]
MPEFVAWGLALTASYLIGAIPFGLLVGRLMHRVDIRTVGSGNVGATNTLRALGWRAAALVFLGDVGKAAIAVMLGSLLIGTSIGMGLCAVAAIAGHNWSIYINWRGGRGVSSAFGSLLAISWPTALISLLVAVGITLGTRYVSLGSIVGTLVGLIAVIVLVSQGYLSDGYLVYAPITAALVIFQHRDNIRRLVLGTERKLGDSGKPASG